MNRRYRVAVVTATLTDETTSSTIEFELEQFIIQDKVLLVPG